MSTAYFVSGLGADGRLFKKQFEENLNIKVIPWLLPERSESLESYAKRMAQQIPDAGPVILGGVSFGGIMAIEMSQHVETQKIILISTVKKYSEIPWYIRIWKYFPVYKFLGGNFLKKGGIMFRFIFGRMPPEEKSTFIEMVHNSHPDFISWAADKICSWKRQVFPSNIIHLHGTSDLIFPIQKIEPPVIKIQKGTHLMILTDSDRINDWLKKYLS